MKEYIPDGTENEYVPQKLGWVVRLPFSLHMFETTYQGCCDGYGASPVRTRHHHGNVLKAEHDVDLGETRHANKEM